MARAKDAPIVTGGGIDPYVTSTVQQGRAAKENRLLAAMQERGANERAQLASETQLKGQEMAGEQALQGQAARTEADDKRAAEAERARRDDQKFATATQEASQVFQGKQAELAREHSIAMVKGDRAYAEKIMDKEEALRRFDIEKQMVAQERSTNAILSVIKGSINRESTQEKAITTLTAEAERFDHDKDVYERTRTRVMESAGTDKRLDYPVGATIRKQLEDRKKAALRGIGTKGVFGAIGAARGAYQSFKEVRALKGVAAPMAVLQDELNKHQSKVSVEQLGPQNINLLEDDIQNGTISAENIRSTLSVLGGMKEVLDQKRKGISKDDEATYDFWNESFHSVILMYNSVEGLINSKKKIAGSDTETVGSRAQYALGVIRNTSLGGRASRLKELMGGDFNAVFEEMTKSLQVPSLWPIDPNMPPYEQEIRQEENDMLTRIYPELGGVE